MLRPSRRSACPIQSLSARLLAHSSLRPPTSSSYGWCLACSSRGPRRGGGAERRRLVEGRADEPEELAERTGSNADGLYRMLRTLAAVGVFEAKGDRRFANNALSTFLRADVQGSQRANSDASGWAAWGRFDRSARTGKPAFEEVFGADCFTWLQDHAASFMVFQQAMTGLSAASGSAVAQAHDFSSCARSSRSAAGIAHCSR